MELIMHPGESGTRVCIYVFTVCMLKTTVGLGGHHPQPHGPTKASGCPPLEPVFRRGDRGGGGGVDSFVSRLSPISQIPIAENSYSNTKSNSISISISNPNPNSKCAGGCGQHC
jgi:hypothetical protein